MPWTPDDAERHTHKATTQELKELWAKIANETLARTGNEGRAIREACLEAVAQGARTADLGGHLGTSEFTDEVIGRVRAKLEVWASL